MDPVVEALETQDWIAALNDVMRRGGPERVTRLLKELQIHAQKSGAPLPVTSQTPYVNTIPLTQQAPYPGNRQIERRIKSIVRWNAMAMVVEANQKSPGIGGHISTYASTATLYEVGFNHFFRGPDHPCGGDLVYFQGHASPGIYSRAYVERRMTPRQLHAFRRELSADGLPSYPHPWLLPEFWQLPSVSMGLAPLMSIYQARFMRYMEDRGLKERTDQKVWTFFGDGETDEPEALGAISLASRERLDNLIWVVNCNLQRLDGPVRGNGSIVQELEAIFRGAGWNVIKVLWGGDWDRLLAEDQDGRLVQRMGEVVDGDYQKYSVAGGAYIRRHFYGVDERLLKLVEDKSDDELWRMTLGGHDPDKVYAAYRMAFEHRGSPTVILARTIKGYGLGEAGEGRNITHQQKKLNEDELLQFRDRFDIPLTDEEVVGAPLYRPDQDSIEFQYLTERRKALGGYLPARRNSPHCAIRSPALAAFEELLRGTGDHEIATTMAFVRILTTLLRDQTIGKLVVPIVPDEARTFGMDALFRQFGIYSHVGQLYEPVDSDSLLYYKESTDGQILEEGITEAGSLSSFIAAGTADAGFGTCMLPFFVFYSMFGFQRVGDLVWAAADARARGFLIGATSGRTTLNGEGLQHQDGHSHVLASVVPNVVSYDPAYAYELVLIVREGIRRMHEQHEQVLYYLTVGNETYAQPPMPAGVEEGVLRGIYRFRAALELGPHAPRAQLMGSGALLNEVVKAQQLLAESYGVAADVWSATSYTELRREAMDVERWNVLHPGEEPRRPYVTRTVGSGPGVFVANSDYMKSVPDAIAKWLPRHLYTLGTDGFGRSDTRETLRDYFEVDARYVTLATLYALAREGMIDSAVAQRAVEELGINPEKLNPAHV
ncbi:MAG: pyruvate dehydrogenase (acetyl-transferring), homodimeric type [Dehalococcoidia bacterium]|nr:pyruvate dehydrogenase (acetyl-transferring), homodimeric type [Dehalococcoidia bacterium]